MSHILITDEHVYASFPYDPEVVREIKQWVDGRRWDPDMQVWVAPWIVASTMVAAIVGHYYPDVVIEDQRVRHKPKPEARQTSESSWACQMFRALPQQLRRPAYLALTKVLHPDVGGETAEAQS